MLAVDSLPLLEAELNAEYAGTGMWGTMFRATGRLQYHRLIPNDLLDADQRAQLTELRKRPRRPGLAPLVDGPPGDQREIGGRWYQVVTYETKADRSLADAVSADSPQGRLRAVAAAFAALPEWWKSVGHGMLPMPSEIVFEEDRPVLLPLPPWGVPPVGEILAEPERVGHLSPEATRGVERPGREGDLFAMSAAALRSFYALPEAGPESLLHVAACADLHTPERTSGRIPLWMSRTDPVKRVRSELLALTGPDEAVRTGADPAAVAESIRDAMRAMDPLTTLRSLCEAGSFRAAVDLAYSVLLDAPDYEVMLLAAETAHQRLHSPLEALSMLERAVETDPDRTDAYAAQLSVASDDRTAVFNTLDDSFARRLDATVQRAFDRLPVSERRERAHDMTRYLMGRGELVEANAFAHRWLHDGSTLMWWRFDLMLDYAETFLLLDRIDAAEQIAAEVKRGLRRVRENGHMSRAEIHEPGTRLADFELRLLAERGRQS